MNTDYQSRRELRRNNRNSHNNGVFTGLFLVIIGAGLFLNKINIGLPHWLFSWEVLLIFIGLYIGVKHEFRGPAWIVLVLIGGLSLQDEIFPWLSIKQYTWPIILVVAGLYIIARPKRVERRSGDAYEPADVLPATEEEYVDGDRLDITSVLGSVKKVVVSKNFKGGEIVSVLGGADINLSQADINGRVKLEATNFMGGTKLIIPSSWDVQSEIVAILGGVEDKRDIRTSSIDPNKVLVLEGTCMFGGIEIKSY